MSIPDSIREKLRKQMWDLADQIEWASLSTTDKRRYYENWTRDPKIGGVLAKRHHFERVREREVG
jgi:hypothetical protein